jgi:cytidylate kinase
MRCIIALSSSIGAGKSSVARALAEYFGIPRISCGDYVREVAQQRGIDTSRVGLQELGESLVEIDPRDFSRAVLARGNWKAGAVIDGVRHFEIYEALQQLAAPLPVLLVYVEVDEAVRLQRLAERGMSPEEINASGAHSTEVQVRDVLRDRAVLRLRGDRDTAETVGLLSEWLNLLELSGRIARLIQSVPKLRDSLDYLLGAVYGLLIANELAYAERDFPLPDDYWKAPLKRAEDMAVGIVRKDGKWAAGFFYNSALLRIAADYHRVLKVLTHKDGHVPALLKLVDPPFEHKNLDSVHVEVNDLKHTPQGLASGRRVRFPTAVGALKELIDLIESRQAQFA